MGGGRLRCRGSERAHCWVGGKIAVIRHIYIHTYVHVSKSSRSRVSAVSRTSVSDYIVIIAWVIETRDQLCGVRCGAVRGVRISARATRLRSIGGGGGGQLHRYIFQGHDIRTCTYIHLCLRRIGTGGVTWSCINLITARTSSPKRGQICILVFARRPAQRSPHPAPDPCNFTSPESATP